MQNVLLNQAMQQRKIVAVYCCCPNEVASGREIAPITGASAT